MSLHDMISERYDWIQNLYTSQDPAIAQKLFSHVDVFVSLTRNARKKQIKRIKRREMGTRNSALYLTQLAELRNLCLFSNRIVRVFDELILNPGED